LASASVGIINTTTNDTAYVLTDIYGKYSFGVSYGNYKVFAKKDGYIASSYSQAIAVNATNRTYSGAEVTLTALATLEGKVTLVGSSDTIPGVTISLVEDGEIRYSVVTDRFGEYRIEGIEDGSYIVSAAKKAYDLADTKSLTASVGIIRGNYDFTLKKGDLHTLKFSGVYNSQPYTGGIFTLIFPYLEAAEQSGSNYFVDTLTSGEYHYSFLSGKEEVLDITKSNLTISETAGDTVAITRELSLTTTVLDTFNTKTNVVSFSVNSPGNLGKMYVSFKKVGDEEYESKEMVFSSGVYRSNDTLSTTGYILDYFYELKNDSVTYSNKNRPYYTFVKLVSQLDYIKWNPDLPDTSQAKVVLINTPFTDKVDGYNRGTINNSLISSIQWESSDVNVVSFKSAVTATNEENTVYPMKEGTAIITANVSGSRGENLSIEAKIEVFDGEIDSAYILRTDKSPDDYRILNDEIASFTVKAKITKKDKSSLTINLLTPINTYPSRGLSINSGEITFNDNFVGQLKLSTRIPNYGEITYHSESNLRESDKHLHVMTSVNEGDTVTNYRNLSIYFPDSSFVNRGSDQMSITEQIFTTNQKIVGKYESVDEIFDLKLVNNSKFNKPVTLIYNVEEEFRERENFVLSYYNDSLLEFEIVDSTTINEKDSIVELSTTHFSTYSLMAEREPLSIRNVVFSPNPFSPYVYARDNNKKYPGLGIKFFSSSQEDDTPTIKIEIFTMSGVRIWSKTGGTDEVTSGNQEFSWDGRQAITGIMSPNGRYIVKITASEKKTGKEIIYKGIVVLVK